VRDIAGQQLSAHQDARGLLLLRLWSAELDTEPRQKLRHHGHVHCQDNTVGRIEMT